MSTQKNISRKTGRRRDDGHRLRVRGVLYEDAKARAKAFKRKTYKALHLYAAEQLAPHPPLLDFAAEGGIVESLKIVTGAPSDKKAFLERLRLMKQGSPSSRLVALVVPLPELNGWPLKSTEVATQAPAALARALAGLVALERPHSCAVKRGGKSDVTHAHFYCQAESLSLELLALAEESQIGKGGGGLLPSGVHVCIVGDTEKDLERSASYASRDGDEALHLPDQDSFEYLAALSRKVAQRGIKAPSLIWHQPKRLSAFRVY